MGWPALSRSRKPLHTQHHPRHISVPPGVHSADGDGQEHHCYEPASKEVTRPHPDQTRRPTVSNRHLIVNYLGWGLFRGRLGVS
jgi:hypothetical protein